MKIFLKTFAISFLLITLVLTVVLGATGAVSDILDTTVGSGDDAPVLELELDYVLRSDSPFFNAFSRANKANILLLGVDDHNLTDTIILVSFDIDHKHIDLIWIPRDTYYYRGSGYIDQAHHKVNAYFRGNPVNTAKAVSEILIDIPINYYAMISYEGIEEIIESMGGVPIDVPRAMRYSDPKDTPPLHINIPEGPQVLDGKTSIQFLRFRSYPTGDLGRVQAQQQFMRSAFKQALGFELPRIAMTSYNNVQTDITVRTVLALTSRAIGITSEDVRTYTMPGNLRGDFVQPDRDGIIEMLTEIYSLYLDKESEEEFDKRDGDE